MKGILRAGLSLLLMAFVSLTSFAVIATPTLDARELGTPPEANSSQSASPMTDPVHKISRLNDPATSSMYYVSVNDPGLVNALLEARGIPLVKGKQIAGMPVIRVLELDPKTFSEMNANPGVERILPYMAPDYEDPIAYDKGSLVAPPSPNDYDVDVVQGAVEAWSLGYFGAGVKIAVIDTGMDMAHPDLQGQQARYTSGPYSGWPIVYDDYSAMVWDMNTIGGWIANTTATSNDTGGSVTYDNASYSVANITDALGNPVASASGVYHIGYHTDWNLRNKVGYPVGVLVVDSTTPGVYDTVYVDVLGDHDFGNDKPCTKGDEISYFDSYNSTDATTQTVKWDAGDGFADVSGGMVYWISDGVNVLPGSNWTYGATFAPHSGDAVAFVGEFTLGEQHGTMTSSAVLGVGRSMGGQLKGMAPEAKLIAIPFTLNIYNSWLFAENGADGVPNTGDEANIVSNSYGWSETAVDAGYEYLDQAAGATALLGGKTLWSWAAGNGGPGYATTASVVDFTSIRVGAGTTMQYRSFLSIEQTALYSKWGDVAPFSNSGPTRTGKLNPEIIASGMYSLEPAPLNGPDFDGRINDGSKHFQLGSGTSHAAPTVAGGAALGYQAYYAKNLEWPSMFLAKAELMASADDMHFDPFKQGAGWLNATNLVKVMAGLDGTISITSSRVGGFETAELYPGTVYSTPYESFPDFLLPGQNDSSYVVTTENLNTSAVTAEVSAQLLIKTGSDLIRHNITTNETEYVDITSHVRPGTDLLKVTSFIPLSVFDPDLDYVTNTSYNLELHDWVDLNADGAMNTTGILELFRYSVDSSDCNYNQIMIKDPIERTHNGLVLGLRPIRAQIGVNFSIQIDSYELQPFPWVELRRVGDASWTQALSFSVPGGANVSWQVRISVPAGTPVGSYGAAIYVDSGDKVQSIPVVINVPASDYEFAFGERSPFDTPYNNNFTGLANKQWRYDTGDWRMYWSLPSAAPQGPNAYLMASVAWTELPTMVNVYVLAADKTTFHRPPFSSGTLDSPWGPGWDMAMIASSDDRYKSAGIFGVGSNTGGPKEVVAAPLGKWMADTSITPSPFAVLIRSPVMSGNFSQDSFTGSTAWMTLNGFEPEAVWLNITVPGKIPLSGELNATYNITSAEPVEVRGGGTSQLEKLLSFLEPVYQDALPGSFEYNLAHADYTRRIEVADVDSLTVKTRELFGVPDLDLGLWWDVNRNGIADLTEPHWYDGVLGSTEKISLTNPHSGTYLIKILGYNVTGNPGYFVLEVLESFTGYIEARGFESPATSGQHNFTIAYNVSASPGTYRGKATFGFLGATDMFSIPVTITIIDQPVIENLIPRDRSILNTSNLEASFHFLDVAGGNIGLDPSKVRVYLDGLVNISPWVVASGDNVTLSYSYGLSQGWHTITVTASDLDGNAAEPATNAFNVNSLIDSFSFAVVNPKTNGTIPNGATVSLTNVTIAGHTDPDANVTVTVAANSYEAAANSSGAFEVVDVQLLEGLNVITVTTTNSANVTAQAQAVIVSDTFCRLVIDPIANSTRSDVQSLAGVTELGASLTVNGAPVPISPDGSWSFVTGLFEGPNYIYINATDKAGNEANMTLYVVSDRTAPALAIIAPSDGVEVRMPVVDISGTAEPYANVTVNDSPVATWMMTTGSWTARVALVNGTNIIRILATDAAGNSAERIMTVVYIPPDYVTPDEFRDALDQLNNSLKEKITDAEGFASLVMFITLILFLISVFFTGAIWYVMGRRLKDALKSDEEEESLEEIEEESPKDVEREFEELEQEIRRDEGT